MKLLPLTYIVSPGYESSWITELTLPLLEVMCHCKRYFFSKVLISFCYVRENKAQIMTEFLLRFCNRTGIDGQNRNPQTNEGSEGTDSTFFALVHLDLIHYLKIWNHERSGLCT